LSSIPPWFDPAKRRVFPDIFRVAPVDWVLLGLEAANYLSRLATSCSIVNQRRFAWTMRWQFHL
jgi:hypothetical protein